MSHRALALVTAILLVLIGVWFFLTHEKVTRSQYVGYQGVARYNDFLAAELLLQELGLEAESRSSLTPSQWLPETADTIFSRLYTEVSVPEQRQLLLGWVRNGGHLVMLPPAHDTVHVEAFLDDLGYRYVELNFDPGDSGEDPEPQQDAGEEGHDYQLELAPMFHRIEVADDAQQSATLSDEIGIIAARRSYGSGYITVLAGSYFHNDILDVDDHAKFLLNVVAGYIDPGKIWLIYDTTFPPLWELIWLNAPFVVAGSLLLLVVALWAAIPKFGPRVHPQAAARRSIIEHVRAAGVFSWRQRGSDDLAKSVVKTVLHEAESRHPGIGRLPLRRQAEQIAQMTGRDPAKVFQVLASAGDHRHREFTQHVSILQRIRKEL